MPYNILCAVCGRELVCRKNGVYVALTDDRLGDSSGICRADYYVCECGNEVLTGFGASWSAPIPNEKLRQSTTFYPYINKWYNKP